MGRARLFHRANRVKEFCESRQGGGAETLNHVRITEQLSDPCFRLAIEPIHLTGRQGFAKSRPVELGREVEAGECAAFDHNQVGDLVPENYRPPECFTAFKSGDMDHGEAISRQTWGLRRAPQRRVQVSLEVRDKGFEVVWRAEG